MKILITGAGGMVGRNLQDHAGLKAHSVLAPSRKDLNLLDYAATLSFIKAAKPDLIVHSAGIVGGIQDNIKRPVEFLVGNIDIGRNLIGASFAAGVKKLLNLGSSCMYPRNIDEALDEDLILKGELEPTNEGYAIAKVMAERYCRYLMRENPGLQYKTLVPCNLFGRYDKFDPAHSHLLPAIVHKLHLAKTENSPTVEIWGDGQARREFMLASDLADCMVRAFDHFDTLPSVMNVGLGHDYSVQEYYDAAAKVIGFKGKFVYDKTKPVGMKRKLVSIKKQEAWGWKSQTSLEKGIESTYQYYLSLKA